MSKNNSKNLSHLQIVFTKLKTLRPHHLGLNKILCMDYEFRESEIGVTSDPEIIEEFAQPYYKTIERLKLIMKLEWPLTKLDVIFRIFTEILPNELKLFWKGDHYLTERDLYIDSKDLRMIMVYILIQTQCSKLKIDLDIIQEFIPQVLKFTNRSFYITLLQSAFDYIDHMTNSKLNELIREWNSPQSLEKLEKYNKKVQGIFILQAISE